jgi:hypothetical protein
MQAKFSHIPFHCLLIAVLMLLTSSVASASLPQQATLEQLAAGADHVFVANVIGVDMIDANGEAIVDPRAMTGPGGRNTIRLKMKIHEVVASSAAKPPETLFVPLDSRMHYELGQIQKAHAEPADNVLLLLKGVNFQPVVAGVFLRALSDKDEVLRLRKLK